jgi:hypothetical protein
VATCVTSPPYFGLRDYGHDGQIGLEPTPDEFVAALVDVFREVRRVLRDDGTLWLNLGDSYGFVGRAVARRPALELEHPARQRARRRRAQGEVAQRVQIAAHPKGRRAPGRSRRAPATSQGSARHPVDGRVRAAR